MKKSLVRVLSLLLAVILAFGLMPTVSYAGGDVDIDKVNLHIVFPMAGQHPNTVGVPCNSLDSKYYTVDYCYYYNDDGMGRVVYDEETFVNGETYKAQVHLYAKEGYDFTSSTSAYINGRYVTSEDVYLVNSNEVFYAVSLTAANQTVKVTLDPNGYGLEPRELQVPKGGTIWDAIRNFDVVREPDQPDAHFYDWSDDPFETDGCFPFTTTITAPLTLYGVWQKAVRTVDLYVQLPKRLTTEDVYKPTIRTGRYANYTADANYFYLNQADFNSADGNVYYPFSMGMTYYSWIDVYCTLGSELPTVNLYGAKKLYVERIDNYQFRVVYSVTMPKSSATISAAEFFIETPRAGTSANTCYPDAFSLTTGVEAEGSAWYTNGSAVNLSESFTGNFVGGQTYYTMVELRSPYNMNSDMSAWKVTPRGWKVKVLEKYDLGAWYSLPTYLGVVTSVTIPRQFELAADIPYGGGKLRYDRAPNDYWYNVLDFTEEEGSITVEAKADPDKLFKSWYDAKTYETLSKTSTYTFNLNKNTNIRANFVKKPPFVDVGAWDYYYEPVMWAIGHNPVITGGTDSTHFSPKQACTREQIVTFLWKANGAPTPTAAEIPFSDVKPGKYYTKAVLWAVENGITGGVGGGKFGVGQTCTREQAMTFLWKAKGSPNPSSYYNPFSDVKEGKYYYKAVLWAVNRTPQVTGGVGGGQVGVGQTCTRAQIITFLAKVYGPVG